MFFKYPLKDIDSVHIKLFDSTNTDVDGQPLVLFDDDVKCTKTSNTKLISRSDGSQVMTSCTIYKKGDLFEGIENITGTVMIGGIEKKISYFKRVRVPNKDHVHHVEIGVE